MPFPKDRYQRAGISPEKVAELEAGYDALTVREQESYDARLAPLSDYEIAASLSDPVAEDENVAEDESEADGSGDESGIKLSDGSTIGK